MADSISSATALHRHEFGKAGGVSTQLRPDQKNQEVARTSDILPRPTCRGENLHSSRVGVILKMCSKDKVYDQPCPWQRHEAS